MYFLSKLLIFFWGGEGRSNVDLNQLISYILKEGNKDGKTLTKIVNTIFINITMSFLIIMKRNVFR